MSQSVRYRIKGSTTYVDPATFRLDTKALGQLTPAGTSMSGGWYPLIREPYSGAWQQNAPPIRLDTVLTYNTVYACVSLISADVGKCRIRLVQQDEDGIWSETDSPSFSPVLRKPNRYQTRIKFFQQWVISKLIHGNTYVLKQRDNRGVVVALYVLDPTRVKPLVAPDGAVYYELRRDDLSGQPDETITVPAREIIHDINAPLFHPLIGVSPISACGLAATQGLAIQQHGAKFFANGASPGGIITAPGHIPEDTAVRVKANWEANFTGDNAGRTAVLGDGLHYEAMTMKATDAQMIEQLKWTAENVCSAFHVPRHKVGVGEDPAHANIEALDQQYYTQCLQILIEEIELCLDEGLELPKPYGTEFDLDDLLRMDTATMITTLARGVGAAIYSPDDARRKIGLGKVKGGGTPYLQQQNYSLEALNKRDSQADPFATATPTGSPPAVEATPAAPADEPAPQPAAKALALDDDAIEIITQAALFLELGGSALGGSPFFERTFNESDHPRGEGGRWTDGSGGGSSGGGKPRDAKDAKEELTKLRVDGRVVAGDNHTDRLADIWGEHGKVSLTEAINRLFGPKTKNVELIAPTSAPVDKKRIIMTARDLLNPKGERIGEMSRTLDLEAKSAYHDTLFLDRQGSDEGKRILASAVDLYNDLGIKKVGLVTAAVGGYAWPKYGFKPTEKTWVQPDGLRDQARINLANTSFSDPDSPLTKAVAGAARDLVKPGQINPENAWAISDLETPVRRGGTSGQVSLGKSMLLETGWGGELDLKDASSMERFHDYIKRRKG